ncbi:MAG: bifunctional homocysteine S-methyltransferase/methylenetetrahydrofolate reductase [Candidatus Eiseniibacteriota bacterium]|nr:MAG: bifunctional homocysteine S-methyltransferase/methylenetetrahydrofolate reductase [Candidatus Eisenbacteria bacterium]
MKENLVDRLRSGAVIVADGAMGTALYARGAPKGHCYDELNLSNPSMIKAVHAEYAAAGAELIETNTFGANRFVLSRYYDLGTKTFEINLAGVRIAREACPGCYVGGSVGPVSRPLDTTETPSREETARIYAEQISALVEGGVDLIILETMSDLEEAKMALEQAIKVGRVPVAVQMSFSEEGRTITGVSPSQAVVELADMGALIVGANCGNGPQATIDVIRKMAGRRQVFLSAMPNAGLASYTGGKFSYPHNPDYFASRAEELLNLGVTIVGGCCGTTHEHIAALSSHIAGKKVTSPRRGATQLEKEVRVGPPPVVTTPLKEMVSRKFTVAVELSPPKGTDLAADLASARELKEAGADAVSISESPMARIRMSPVALGHRIKSELGMDVILHFTCRDRNILGLQADLLSVYALGMVNILALTGDPPSVGDYPFATGVYEVNSRGLVEIANKLNSGVDYLGNKLSSATSFWIGAAASPSNPDRDGEIRRLGEKLKAGAQFVVTQPVFDVEGLLDFVKKADLGEKPVFAGLMPLVSSKQAEFLHHEVPGITIPESIRQSMRDADEEKARQTGITIAARILSELSEVVSGVCIMVPLRRYSVAAEVMAKANLSRATRSGT